MLDLARIRALARDSAYHLPWWVGESVEGMADRIEELEGLLVSVMDENERMFAVLLVYAAAPDGGPAREITEQ